MSEVKPCPFCGSSDIAHTALQRDGVRVCICRTCRAHGPAVLNDTIKGANSKETDRLRADAAYEKWNTRTPPPGYVMVPEEYRDAFLQCFAREFIDSGNGDWLSLSSKEQWHILGRIAAAFDIAKQTDVIEEAAMLTAARAGEK